MHLTGGEGRHERPSAGGARSWSRLWGSEGEQLERCCHGRRGRRRCNDPLPVCAVRWSQALGYPSQLSTAIVEGAPLLSERRPDGSDTLKGRGAAGARLADREAC